MQTEPGGPGSALAGLVSSARRRSGRPASRGAFETPPSARESAWSGEGAPRPARLYKRKLLIDNVRLHAAERAQQIVLLLRADLELVEALHEVFHQRFELPVADLHALVRVLHRGARVGAGSA